MSGTFLSAVVWIEVFGFHHTLWLAAVGNFTIAVISAWLGWQPSLAATAKEIATARRPPLFERTRTLPEGQDDQMDFVFDRVCSDGDGSGVARAFTPVLKTQVYSFAMIVFTYLGATFLGSWMYRRDLRAHRQKPLEVLIPALAVLAFFPVLMNNPKLVVASYWKRTSSGQRHPAAGQHRSLLRTAAI